jgi:hypothetical protein
MRPRQVSEIFTVFKRKSEPRTLVVTRVVVAIFFIFILAVYIYVQIGKII